MNLEFSYGLNDQLIRHKYVACIVILLAGSFLATYILFFNKTLPVSHDILFHVYQADQFYRVLESGVIFPHWAFSYNNGYGSPNFIFYAPLSYYTVAAFHAIGLSLINSLKIVIWLSFLFSGVTMFTALNRISSHPSSLLCAVFYQILPFHLIDLHYRGTLAELMAFIWFPLIIIFVHDLFQAKGSTIAGLGLAVSYAGLIITHLVSGFIFTFVLTAYLSFCHLRHKEYYLVCRAILFIVLGFGLSSFYLLPIMFERQFVKLDLLLIYSFKENFLFIPGYLFSRQNKFLQQLHFFVIVEALLYFVLLVRIYKNKIWQASPSPQAFFLYLFPIVFIFMTPLAKPLWEVLPGFAAIQFPWRWISVLEVSLCFILHSTLSGTGAEVSWVNFSDRILVYLIGIVFVSSCLLVASSNQFYSRNTMEGITDPERIESYNNLPREYTPREVTALEELYAAGGGERISILSGNAASNIVEWQPERRIVAFHASTPTKIRVALFNYPGWKAMLDGREVSINVQEGSGAIIVDIPTGKHSLTLGFVDTPLRLASKYLSLFSFIVVLAVLMFQSMKHFTKTSYQVTSGGHQ